jgi:hypothetical protein
MKRTPLKRGSPMKRGKGVRRRSAKKVKRDEIRAEVLMGLLMERGNACEAHVEEVCQGGACDGHEVLSRGRGGDPALAENSLLVCRPCHDWIHGHPVSATELGLLRSASEPDNHGDHRGAPGLDPDDEARRTDVVGVS